MEIGSLLVNLVAETMGFSTGLNRAKSDLKGFENQAKASTEKTKGFFKSMSADLGKKSFLGQSLKMLAGGGAVGALSMASNEFNDLTKKAEELAGMQYKSVEQQRKMTAEFLTSIPIAGKLGEAFARIWEMASGTTAEVAKMNAQMESQNRLIEMMQIRIELHKKLESMSKKYADEVQTSIVKLFSSAKEFDAWMAERTTKKKEEEDLAEVRNAAKKELADLRNKSNEATKAYLEMVYSGEVGPNFRHGGKRPVVPEKKDRELARMGFDVQNAIEAQNEWDRLKDAMDKANKEFADATTESEKKIAEMEQAINNRPFLKFGEDLKQTGTDILDFFTGVVSPVTDSIANTAKRSDAENMQANWKAIQEEQKEKAKELNDILQERLDIQKELQNQANRWLEDIKTPEEKFKEQVGELQAMIQQGFLTKDQAQKVYEKMAGDFLGNPKQQDLIRGEYRGPAFYTPAEQQKTTEEELVDQQRKVVNNTEKTVDVLEQMLQFYRNPGTDNSVITFSIPQGSI